MIRKSIVLFTVFAFIFGMAGMALAANRVEVKVTSEPIPLKSTCSKAGGFSLEFDEGTYLRPGDIITVDLDFGVTLCNSFDYVVSPNPALDPLAVAPFNTFIQLDADGNYVSGDVFTGTNTPDVSLQDAAFTQTTKNYPVTGANTIISNGGVAFRVVGMKDTQRLTIYVIGPVGATMLVDDANPNQADVVTLNILDEKNNPPGSPNPPNPANPEDWFVDQLWEVGTTARVYDDSADWDDNTLCINVSSDLFTKTVVNASMDSRNDKYTFIPSNPQIAHVATPYNVELFSCKTGGASDNIVIPNEQGSCRFDYESGSGYCTGNDTGRRIIFDNLGGFFDDNTSYSVKLEITSPTNFVYWGGGTVGYQTQENPDCTTATEGVLGFRRAYNRNGSLLASFTGDSGTCTVADAQKATTVETTAADIFTANNRTGLWLNLPNLVFDKDNIQAGDEVKVKVTLQTFPCGTIVEKEISLGVFGCDQAGTTGRTLIYPYFTQLDSAISGWWNGIVVTNLSSTEGTATFHLYESDGDQATLEQTVAANSTFVTLLEPTLAAMTTVVTGDGVLGNATGYIIVCTDFLSDGFAMIANNEGSDVNGSESMGYLPRYDRGMSVCTTP